ncbi:1-phosphofructokinase [Pseudonocardia sulfidoxydans NBRC 16205]|uniref:1-phosphofructokinase n=1 Tax=Pseudonocardia sulfidoxydans NBRC 16205 TaxID=1223511 RepID=A0A511DFV9_9PSEU|nr:PfkB family carbohydrate kinase [Pseudonocardia sulfidoxydans]GEL23417.1 1-phosphofructokinase [Pseudonocardia sulfidoxydans NBRC 16205]
MSEKNGSPVVVFAPSPIVTVTIEDRAGGPELHVHAGGQGVWQSRMLATLGTPVVLCAGLGGETGLLLERMIAGDGVDLRWVATAGRNGGYVHDRRGSDERTEIAAEHPAPLDRHELDALYELTLAEGLCAGTVLLSGAQADDVVPASIYRRLAADLRANGVRVVADLSGERLEAAVEGGLDLLKVSDEELVEHDRADSRSLEDIVRAARVLRDEGVDRVVVSRAHEPAVAVDGERVLVVTPPPVTAADPRGAGDSQTAGMTARLAAGGDWEDVLRIGAACGALNVVRHGLGTGRDETVDVLAARVELAAHR